MSWNASSTNQNWIENTKTKPFWLCSTCIYLWIYIVYYYIDIELLRREKLIITKSILSQVWKIMIQGGVLKASNPSLTWCEYVCQLSWPHKMEFARAFSKLYLHPTHGDWSLIRIRLNLKLVLYLPQGENVLFPS